MTRAAREDLARLRTTQLLPGSTTHRLRESLEPLESLPLLGAALTGRWAGTRYLVGPWRWMLIVYEHRPDDDVVAVLAIHDARASDSVTSLQD